MSRAQQAVMQKASGQAVIAESFRTNVLRLRPGLKPVRREDLAGLQQQSNQQHRGGGERQQPRSCKTIHRGRMAHKARACAATVQLTVSLMRYVISTTGNNRLYDISGKTNTVYRLLLVFSTRQLAQDAQRLTTLYCLRGVTVHQQAGSCNSTSKKVCDSTALIFSKAIPFTSGCGSDRSRDPVWQLQHNLAPPAANTPASRPLLLSA
jgi:hypothetical protein